MKEYDESLPFWDTMYGAQDYSDVTYSTDDLNFGCPEMVQCLSDLAQKKRILDYGCGDGWQSFALLNAGAKDITAIDPSSRACDTGASIAERRGDSDKIRFVRGTEELLEAGSSDAASESSSSPSCAGPYDGFISVNVLDVVPESVATRILNAIKASLAPEAEGLILLNPAYSEEKLLQREGASLVHDEEGNVIPHHIAFDGILRQVVRSSDEWVALLSHWFDVTFVGDFAFTFEEAPQYKRRIFKIRNKA